MRREITVTPELTQELYRNTIFLKLNSPPPADGVYGWLKEGAPIRVHRTLRIEQNVGLYGGAYKPMVGGRRSSGLANVGAFTYSYSPLPDLLDVGRYCSISRGLKFIDSQHPLETISTSALLFRPSNRLFSDYATEGIRAHKARFSPHVPGFGSIGHDVWIGDNATISNKATIGTGAVLAANATVTKDVPPYAIVGGNPAKIIRFRFDEETIAELLASEWWEYEPRQLFSTVEDDARETLRRLRTGGIERFQPRAVTISGDPHEWPSVPRSAPDTLNREDPAR